VIKALLGKGFLSRAPVC